MNQYDSLFPGIRLRFICHTGANAPRQHEPHEAKDSALEINYCSRGRMGWHMKHNTMVYLGEGDLSINAMSCCARSHMDFPLGYYEGIRVILDFDKMLPEIPPVLLELGLSPHAIRQKTGEFSTPATLLSNREIKRIFSGVEKIPPAFRSACLRLRIQELLFFLFTQDFSSQKEASPYPAQHTERIKEIHGYLTRHLDRRITIEELSQKYLINTSTLKEVFKGVYGQPVASYMKEYRMKYAMKRLRSSSSSIADIALEVGYESQSKFSSAFKKYAGVLPTQYRKH